MLRSNNKKISGFRAAALSISVAAFTMAGSVQADNKLAVERVSETGLSVMVLGSGGPIASPVSGSRASAGYLIFVDGKPRILMDVGGGTYKNLAESGANIKDLEFVLLTHLHADHTGDLTPVIKTLYFHNVLTGNTRSDPINIYGPARSTLPPDGEGRVTYDDGTYAYPSSADYVDGHYSIEKGGVERYLTAFVDAISQKTSEFAYTANDLPLKYSAIPGPISQSVRTIYDEGAGGLSIKYIPVDHGPVPSVAYRIEYDGQVISYSGDTGTKGIGGNVIDTDDPADGIKDTITFGWGAGNMVKIAQGADLLIYDTAVMECCDLPSNPIFHILHTQPSLIAGVAINAGVDTLVLSHLTPVTSPRVNEIEDIIEGLGFGGEIEKAKDLKVYNLSED